MDRVYITTKIVLDKLILKIKVPMEWDDEERNLSSRLRKESICNYNCEIYDFFHDNTSILKNTDKDINSKELTDDDDYYNDDYDQNRVIYEYWKDKAYTNNESNFYLEDTSDISDIEYVMNEELLETNAIYL